MKRVHIGIALLIAACGVGYPATIVQQREVVPDGWKRVSACDVRFLIPASVKNQNARGIDSCVAAFGDGDIGISLDYGWYGGPYEERKLRFGGELEGFKEEFVRVGGRRAQVVTYHYGGKGGPQEYVASMYVFIRTDKGLGGIRMNTSLNMTVTVRGEGEREVAMRILRSVRFELSAHA